MARKIILQGVCEFLYASRLCERFETCVVRGLILLPWWVWKYFPNLHLKRKSHFQNKHSQAKIIFGLEIQRGLISNVTVIFQNKMDGSRFFRRFGCPHHFDLWRLASHQPIGSLASGNGVDDVRESAFDRRNDFLWSAHAVNSLYGSLLLSVMFVTTSENTFCISLARRLKRNVNSFTYRCKCFLLIWWYTPV